MRTADMNDTHIDLHTDVPGMIVVAVSGEVDLAVHDTLLESLHTAIKAADRAGIGTVVVDLNLTSFLDSTGVRVLVKSRDMALTAGVEFSVTGASGLVHRVLEITGVLKTLTGGDRQPHTDPATTVTTPDAAQTA
uniref:Anti-sigma factor antagonist n=1 Tax=uncultured bacterium esnapd14 TaxID=1366594 RepID=S5TUR5_9BACT|nr:hypothetical protein [uncultured bacterium esnapd14]